MTLRILCALSLGLLIAGCGDSTSTVFAQDGLQATPSWFSLRPGDTLDLVVPPLDPDVPDGETAEGIEQTPKDDNVVAFQLASAQTDPDGFGSRTTAGLPVESSRYLRTSSEIRPRMPPPSSARMRTTSGRSGCQARGPTGATSVAGQATNRD